MQYFTTLQNNFAEWALLRNFPQKGEKMSTGSTITKTVWQYSEPLPDETMEFLRGIAADCCKVKNYVYGKYSGVRHLNSLTPVYGILNEMRRCGLREQLNLPAVYYELAVADAVTDIKSSWGIVRNRVGERITANENLTDSDRLYLRTVLKMNGVYAAVLNRQEYEMPRNAAGLDIDVNRLNNLLCRLTRRYLTRPRTDCADAFRISPNGYSYRDGAIRIVCRTPRKRVSIPLKDDRTSDRQINIQIRQNDVVLAVPVETRMRRHPDYTGTVYAYIGSRDMLTLSNGHVYGAALEELTNPETERLARKNRERRRMYTAYARSAEAGDARKAGNIEANNLGRDKYDRQKERERQRTTTFINAEINRMIRDEKPARIVITRAVTKNRTKIYAKSANRKLARTFNGYIRERIAYKCRLHSIELVEISSKNTGSACSSCGSEGKRQGTAFVCGACGYAGTIALNSARNIQQKYQMADSGSHV